MYYIDRLREHAASNNNAAVVTDTYELGYPALLGLVLQSAAHLNSSGIGPGEIVGITLEDEVAHLVVSLALTAVGAGQITLASFDSGQLHAKLSARMHISRVIGSVEQGGLEGDNWYLGNGPCAAEQDAILDALPDAGGMFYLKTSGTTGNMNIVPFREEQLAAQSEQLPGYTHERLLRLATIEHNNSKRHRLYCVWMGGTNVFRPPQSLAADIVQYTLSKGVTCLDISRIHASDIAAMDNACELAEVKIRTGGTAVPYPVRQRLECEVTRLLYVRYAATECGPIAMAAPGEHDADETVGVPLNGVDLQVVDAADLPVPANEAGAIRLRAPGMADHYFDSPEDSAARFREGWFYPGDMGCFTEQGKLRIMGRADDMIILNGLNIFPAEIEQVLESHPDVRIATALGIPSKVHGHIPVAAVELEDGAKSTGLDLQKFAKEQLNLRTPRRIVVVDSIPRNSQGKIMRQELAEHF